jgi:hypothetical protein
LTNFISVNTTSRSSRLVLACKHTLGSRALLPRGGGWHHDLLTLDVDLGWWPHAPHVIVNLLVHAPDVLVRLSLLHRGVGHGWPLLHAGVLRCLNRHLRLHGGWPDHGVNNGSRLPRWLHARSLLLGGHRGSFHDVVLGLLLNLLLLLDLRLLHLVGVKSLWGLLLTKHVRGLVNWDLWLCHGWHGWSDLLLHWVWSRNGSRLLLSNLLLVDLC